MSLVLAILSFAVAVVAHFGLSRFIQRSTVVNRFLLVCVICGLLLIGLLVSAQMFSFGSILVYAFLCELYLFLFTLAGNSVSLSIAMRLLDRPLTIEQIASVYAPDLMVERRLEQLARNRLIFRSVAGWQISSRGATLVRVFGALRSTFRQITRSG